MIVGRRNSEVLLRRIKAAGRGAGALRRRGNFLGIRHIALMALLLLALSFSFSYATEPPQETTPGAIDELPSVTPPPDPGSGENPPAENPPAENTNPPAETTGPATEVDEEEAKKQREKDELAKLQDELKNAQTGKDQAKKDYEQAKAAEKAIESQIQTLTASIRATEAELAVLEEQIAANTATLDALRIEISIMEADITNQNNDLNSRLRLMYMSGNRNIVEVLLGSENFMDFLENLDMVKRIHEFDAQLLQELEAKLDELETKQAELLLIEESLAASKLDQESKKSKLDADKAALAKAKEQAHLLTQEKYEIYEDNAAAAAALENELRQRSYSGVYSGGIMSPPVVGVVTSEFGYRRDPVYGGTGFHAGIDFAVPTGTPVRAAASGEVIFSGWNSYGYGNFVMIDHGGGVVTCYAHNSGLAVSVGQSVDRGQVIAYAGSTGKSTGPHCHFEVRVKGVAQNPRNWL
jgi:murein DD-endopeptidase MepM/ murein hydrolase activator NlpD